jgi:hypothetical protein
MSNNLKLNKFLVAASFLIIGSELGFAKAPEKLKINCQSDEIGKIEILIDGRNGFGSNEEFYYQMTTKRFDRTSGNYLGSQTHKIDVHSNLAIAHLSTNDVVHLFPEQTLYLKLPAYGVNWQKNSDKCYVIAPSFGIDLTLGIETDTIYKTHSKPYLRLYQTNPDLSFIMVPGVPFAHPEDSLNGEQCPDTNQWALADDTLKCAVVK